MIYSSYSRLICQFFYSKLETELQTTQDMLKQKEEEAHNFQQELQASKEYLWEVEKRLEYQELEIKSAQKSVCDMEKQMKVASQELEESQATVCQQEAELVRLKEVLRRTERELDERVAHLEQRCLSSEEEKSNVPVDTLTVFMPCHLKFVSQSLFIICLVLGRTQEEGLRRVEELKMELSTLQQAKRDERKRQIQLEQDHAALTEELTKEKVTQP